VLDMSLLRQSLLWASQSPVLARRLPRLGFVRRAVSRFMPGETLAEALAACEALGGQGIGSVITLLGENVTDAAEARGVVDHYRGALDEIARRGLDAEVSIKPSHLGMDLDPAAAAAGLAELATRAAGHGTVWVDMEGSATTAPTLDLFRRVRAAHASTGLCLQAYLRRSAADLEALVAPGPHAARIRLVKGAYAEPPSIAFARKAEVDASYLALAERLLAAAQRDGPRPVFGTHDRQMIRRIVTLAEARGVAKSAYEFHLLYGIQRDEQLRLAAAGHRVRVLISYGSAWVPWYMRRLAERPANLGFVLRNLFQR
jgi:proline dehydrogenase